MDQGSSDSAKKAKGSAFPSSSSSQATIVGSSTSSSHGTAEAPLPPSQAAQRQLLPPPPRLQLHSLPDVAHDNIAPFLTSKDTSRMMEVSLWAMNTYGTRVKEIKLHARMQSGHSIIVALLRRRPGLERISVSYRIPGGGLADAMRSGYCNNLRTLVFEMYTDSGYKVVCSALASGACPRLERLIVHSTDHCTWGTREVMLELRKALTARAQGGCRALKALEVDSDLNWSVLLSSPGCDGLQQLQLRLKSRHMLPFNNLRDWLNRTKARSLLTLKVMSVLPNVDIPLDVVNALCSDGVAPGLQSLSIEFAGYASFSRILEAIGQGAWPDLRELTDFSRYQWRRVGI